MASRLPDNLATYIADNTGFAKKTNLFIGRMPDTPDTALYLTATGGNEPNRYIPTPRKTVQVLSRASAYPDAYDNAQTVYDLLHRKNDSVVLETGGVDVMFIAALQEPTHIGLDDQERHVFTVNFQITLRR